MFLQNFIDEQKRLLSLERSEEINQSKILSESPPKILEEKNLCIRKLKIANIFTGLYGRTIVEFESNKTRDESSKRVFSQGDILAVCNDSGKNDINKAITTGLFYKLTKDYIQIALDNDQEDNNELQNADGTSFRLVKLSSEVTYQRLKAGLKYLEKRSNPLCGDYLIDLLMGNGQLRSPDPLKELTYFNGNLNTSQKDAVKFALARPDVAIVHGPPGTGKTTVAVEIISQLISKPNGHKMPKILVCTPSNIALDNLAEKLLKVSLIAKSDKSKSGKSINVLRLGHSARVMSHLSDISLDYKLSMCDQAELISQVRSQIDWTVKQSLNRNGKRLDKRRELSDLRKELREREMKAIREVLNSSQVIMSTLTGLRSNKSLPLNEIEFDVVVIDEVSQAIEAACWLAIPRGKKLILAGDHKQLPPTVLSAEAVKAGLGRSLMERLMEVFVSTDITRMLTCQYRMHEDIMRWSSDTFYEGALVADGSVAGHGLEDLCEDRDVDLGPLSPLVVIDTSGCDLWEMDSSLEDSKANLGEAHLAAVYIKGLVDRFGLGPDQIGVISPYSRQVQLVRQCLRDKVDFVPGFELAELEVSTVDGFQGREKEVIVTTLVRSNHSGTVGFLAETRRLNVALTRAKRHLCVIGDCSTIDRSGHAVLRSLTKYWSQSAEMVSARAYIHDHDISPGQCVMPLPPPQKKQDHNQRKTDSADCRAFEKRLTDKVKKFTANQAETTLELPSELTARMRAIVHELSEQLGLNHVSVGDGADRKLIISKPQPKVKMESVIENEEVEQIAENVHSRDKFNVAVTLPEETTLSIDVCDESLEILEHGHPHNEGLVANAMEIVVESGQNKEEIFSISSWIAENKIALANIEASKEIVKTKKSKKLKPKKVEEEAEDFDAIIDEFQSMNRRCQNAVKCDTAVAVLGFDCRFCKRRFCCEHMQPEVHKCARTDMGVWRADAKGQRPVSKKQEVRHVQLQRAMAKKIGGMTADRTGASAGDKKK